MITLTFTIASIILFLSYGTADEDLIVNTNLGQIKGFLDADIDGNTFYSFLGIPYGKAPVGKLRFKPPVPVEPWTGIFQATKKRNQCVQYNVLMKIYTGKEDCLNLNIFTKDISKTSGKKPVIVFIHGGGFAFGSNWPTLYGPKFLLTEDVVYVALNYRLGLFGGLFFEDDSLGVTGNMGFKDMILALKWIKSNIENFNGDSENVTVFGVSAGGASAHLLMFSPSAKGLFHKVISSSGNALNPWARSYNMIAELKNQSGCSSCNNSQLLEHLENIDAKEVAVLFQTFGRYFPHGKRPSGYTIESPNVLEPFLTKDPIDLILSGNFNDVPMILGFVQEEGCVLPFLNGIPVEHWGKPAENLEDTVPSFLNYSYGSTESENIAAQINTKYFGSDKISTFFCQPDSDINFVQGIYATVLKQSTKANASNYFYLMTADTKLNILKKIMKIKDVPGAFHFDDVGYLFNGLFTPPIPSESVEYVAMKRFVKLWTNFARGGNPTPDPNCPLLNIIWKPIDQNKINLLEIGSTSLTMIDDKVSIFNSVKILNGIFSKYSSGVKYV